MENYTIKLYLNGKEVNKSDFCKELEKTIIIHKDSNKTIYDYLDLKISEMLRSGCKKVGWYLKDTILNIEIKKEGKRK